MDYMKGYHDRTTRRRSSYRKNEYGRRELQKYQKRNRRRRRSVLPQRILLCLLAVGVVAAVVFCVRTFFCNEEPQKTEHSVTASGGGIAEKETDQAPKAVPTAESREPEASAVPEPTKTPRQKAVALTFDDGPSTENTPIILKLLKKYDAHATFFVVGNRVKAGADVVRQEIAQGCEVASHSWDHANLKLLSMKGVNKQNDKTVKIVKKLTGYDIKLLRPPFGAISDAMRKKLEMPMILWSVDTLDWKSRDAKAVFKQVKKTVSDGDIILVHDIHASTAEAMKKVIPWLIKQDYDILTVSELMERKGIKMKKGVVYGSAR